MTNTETDLSPKARLAAAMADLGLEVYSTFIPLSESRNNGNTPGRDKWLSLNWTVRVWRQTPFPTGGGGHKRPILETAYSAGSAHAPGYRQGDNLAARADLVAWECEHGFPGQISAGGRIGQAPRSKAIAPDAVDVMHSLIMDSDVLDAGGFEDWARDLGYNPDSRAAESTYRACLEIALMLRAAIGEEGLAKLREAGQDY